MAQAVPDLEYSINVQGTVLKGAITEDDVITNAKLIGRWSVWFTVFKGIDCILRRLISDFPGTCASCFDENNHYEPVERNPGCIDPI